MPVDETIINKSSEEVTGEDVRTLLNAPPEEERPLIEQGVFDEKQPAQPIYKSIPLKFALAGVAALVLTVPAIKLFSGNLLSGDKPTKVTTTKESNTTETEEEKAQRLVAAENADLKRKLALQNQSFTAQEIEDAAATQPEAQSKPAPATTSRPPAPTTPVPLSRPIAAVASRPVTVRSTPLARAITPTRPAIPTALTAPISTTPTQPPVSLAEISAAGNYGQLPSRPLPTSTSAQPMQPVVSTASIPRFVTVADRESSLGRTGSIPVSVRSQQLPAATKAIFEDSIATKRPVPMVVKDNIPTVSAVSKQLEAAPQEGTALDEVNTYEAQRDLIMRETAGLSSASTLPSRILPGSTAELEVNTSVTWTSDLPRALGSVALVSGLISDGVEVVPEGTELIVQIGEMSESGAVALDVVAMVLPNSDEITEIDIPAGALEILAVDGGYPVARADQSSEQQLQAVDRQQALLGAMGKAGDYLNRPQRETNVSSLGGSSSSREYGSGSLWGSLLSGAANEMLRSRASRLDDEAERLIDRPTIWSIESGRRLQLFVTQEVEL